jgi:hypothetical protein
MKATDSLYGTDGFAKALLGCTDDSLLDFITSDDFDQFMPTILACRGQEHVELLCYRINVLLDTIVKH